MNHNNNKRYIISAPRSGLNWLRFLIEKLYGISTPGKKVLVGTQDKNDIDFIRSHDPLRASKRKTDALAWARIRPEETAHGIVLLIVRDPLEVFVRMAKKKPKAFKLYSGNIRFFQKTTAKKKMCVYYEDLISNPQTMKETLAFLELKSVDGFNGFKLEALAENWDVLNDESRKLYDKNQSRGGGSQTRLVADKFTHHQKQLTKTQKLKVWRLVQNELDTDELKLLERYMPSDLKEPISFIQKIKLIFWRMNWIG